MKTRIARTDFLFGDVQERKPFRSAFPGRARTHFAKDRFATVTIRHQGRKRRLLLQDAGDHWTAFAGYRIG